MIFDKRSPIIKSQKFFFIFLLQIIICFCTYAQTSDKYFLGGGLINFGLNHTTSSENGSKTFFGTWHYPLEASAHWKVFETHTIGTRFVFTPLAKSTEDGAADVRIFWFTLPYLMPLDFIGTNWEWSYGLGLMSYMVFGKGGTITLDNGTSTSEFGRPSRNSFSNNFTFDFGLIFYQNSKFRIQSNLIFVSPFSQERFMNIAVTVLIPFNLN